MRLDWDRGQNSGSDGGPVIPNPGRTWDCCGQNRTKADWGGGIILSVGLSQGIAPTDREVMD